MPLPPVLAAKLSKRGLLTSKSKADKEKKRSYKGAAGCPNKYNIHHECNMWCEIHWNGVASPDPKYLHAMQKLLLKYPLPHNWMEIFDKGTGRYYFWDMELDLVSWLPPKHPKAVRSESAAKLREKKAAESEKAEEERVVYKADGKKHESDKRDKEDRHHKYDSKGRKRSRKDDIDPMDPAAYSDVPQGTWSDGLETNKSKADCTASGSLFQQRPYPSPGEVLSANKKQKGKKNVNFGSVSYSS